VLQTCDPADVAVASQTANWDDTSKILDRSPVLGPQTEDELRAAARRGWLAERRADDCRSDSPAPAADPSRTQAPFETAAW